MAVGNVVQLAGTITTANAPIRAVCLYNNGTYAVMCSYGFGHGTWPGSGALSAASYNTSTGSYGISNITLPTGTSASNLAANGVTNQSSLIYAVQRAAASARSSFGADEFYTWLGNLDNSSRAYSVSSDGRVTAYPGTYDQVIAPAFNLSLLHVKINKSTMTLYM